MSETVCPVAARNDPPPPCECGQLPERVILSAAMVQADIRPYQAMAGDKAGKFITSRREHREFLKRNRLTEVGDAPIRPTQQQRPILQTREYRERRRADLREALRAHVPLEILRKTR